MVVYKGRGMIDNAKIAVIMVDVVVVEPAGTPETCKSMRDSHRFL